MKVFWGNAIVLQANAMFLGENIALACFEKSFEAECKVLWEMQKFFLSHIFTITISLNMQYADLL